MAGTISSAGVGSGLDVSAIISKLMAVEQAPLTKLQSVATTMQTQLSAFGQIQSLISAFRDATTPLTKADSYALTSAASSDATAASAGSTAKALPGSYSVSVSALASGQTTVSRSGDFSTAAALVGTGTITIRLGTWSAEEPPAFTAKSGSEDVTIPIGADESTLSGIRDKINAANAGVAASIVTDASGARLALQSAAAGAENGFRVLINDDDASDTDELGLSRLAYDPGGGSAGMALTKSAADTQATINGIAVRSSSTTLSDVIEGMTLTLSKVTTSPVTITVTRNTDALKAMLTGFVAAYNALNGLLSQATKYDPTTKQAALLQGDSTTVGIQNQLRSAIAQGGAASSMFATLSSIGIEFQKDGSLKLNDSKVATALGNLPELQKAFSAKDPANPGDGFATKLVAWADGLLGTDGLIPGKTKAIQDRIKANQKDQDKATDRLSAIEARLRSQYTALDTAMAKANALSQYVNQQITSWNNIKTNA